MTQRSDLVLADLTPQEARTARALLRWSQVRLAAKANLSEATISDFENERRILRVEKRAAIRSAFVLAGVVFKAEGPVLQPGQLQRQSSPDNRARRHRL
ncbi:multiprotein-bridging factor 1 family protein [Mesorhizobium calcicola]|uniref:Multiprotein-bridging factor 1 family protein n=1 Tax=Mesorhizobium calcicola TaxID=1300310 RepID=A0ABW4WEF7_9HYPH